MYEFFISDFSQYLIENSKRYLIYLVPGKKLVEKFDWYGEKRAEAFNILKQKPLRTDIEKRDLFFSHMIIWDKEKKDLAGGQRFLFSKEGSIRNKEHSYLESYHPGTFEKMRNENFCEIGRTFVMPNYQNKRILKELIRGFVRIPEKKNINIGIGLISFNHLSLNQDCINAFLSILKSSNKSPLNLPNGKYLFDHQTDYDNTYKNLTLNVKNLKYIEEELQKIDYKFRMPQVLKPYLNYCGVSYENYSIAKDYNGIIQLLFSGKSQYISEKQRKFLEDYYTFNKDLFYEDE